MTYIKLLTAAALTAGLALGTTLPAQAAATNPNGRDKHFDLQAHRGGLGLTVESTLASFVKGLEVGVSTLELDLQITKDGREVITHDRKINGQKCQDTAPVTPGDPQYPYVGKYIKDLNLRPGPQPRLRLPDLGQLPRSEGLPRCEDADPRRSL